MWIKRRHKFIIDITRPFFKLHFKNKYNLHIDTVHLPKDGALIISNHCTTMDPFILYYSFKEMIYLFTSIDLFEHAVMGKLIRFLTNPIPKEKSKKTDLASIKNAIKVAKENGNVCIFVEGNRTFSGKLCHIDYSIVKLVKLLKKPLVIYNISGGYGTDPRWGTKIRKGQMTCGVKQVYTYDEYKDMSNDDLYKLIVDSLTVDDFSLGAKYKGNKRAEYLERILYVCPVCHKLHTISSKGNVVKCSSCGLEVTYNEDLTLTANKEEFNFKNISEWYDFQVGYLPSVPVKDDEVIYSNEVGLFNPRLFKSKKKLGNGVMKLYNNHIEFELKGNSFKFDFDEIEAMTLLGKKKMNFYVNGVTYQVFGVKNLNLLKYLQMFYFLKNKLEGDHNEFLGL